MTFTVTTNAWTYQEHLNSHLIKCIDTTPRFLGEKQKEYDCEGRQTGVTPQIFGSDTCCM